MTRKPKNTAKSDSIRALREQQASATDNSEAIDPPNPTQESPSSADDAAATGEPTSEVEDPALTPAHVSAADAANQRVLDAEVEEATWVGPTKGAASDHAPFDILHAAGTRVGQYVKAQCNTDAFNVVFMARYSEDPADAPANPTRCVRCIAVIRGEPMPAHAPTAPGRNGTAGPVRRKSPSEARTPGSSARAAKPKLIKSKSPQDVSRLLLKLKAGETLSAEEIAAAVAVLEARAGG